MLIESDNSNPDVYKAHQSHQGDALICGIMDLDSADGWLELVDSAEDHPEHVMVINSPARSNSGIEFYGATLKKTLPQLDRELITFWMINRQRDSVELLRDFVKSFPEAKITVCRNLFFGQPEKFDAYNICKAREAIERKGRSPNFPALSALVADKLYSERIPVWAAGNTFRISEKVKLLRWKNLCAHLFEETLGGK